MSTMALAGFFQGYMTKVAVEPTDENTVGHTQELHIPPPAPRKSALGVTTKPVPGRPADIKDKSEMIGKQAAAEDKKAPEKAADKVVKTAGKARRTVDNVISEAGEDKDGILAALKSAGRTVAGAGTGFAQGSQQPVLNARIVAKLWPVLTNRERVKISAALLGTQAPALAAGAAAGIGGTYLAMRGGGEDKTAAMAGAIAEGLSGAAEAAQKAVPASRGLLDAIKAFFGKVKTGGQQYGKGFADTVMPGRTPAFATAGSIPEVLGNASPLVIGGAAAGAGLTKATSSKPKVEPDKKPKPVGTPAKKQDAAKDND